MKKLLSILLALVIILTLLPMSLVSSALEYITLNYDESVEASIAVGESVWYQFTPTESKTYLFYSSDEVDVDPVASLYDSSMNHLIGNDDSEGRNFRITYDLIAGETYYLEVYDYCKDNEGTVNICVGVVLPTSVNVSPSSEDVFSGTWYALRASVSPSDAVNTLTWTSSDESIATVDENGVVSFLKGGEVTITAETVNGMTDTCEFSITQVDGSMAFGEEKTLTFTDDSPTWMYFVFTPEETGYYRFKSYDIVSELEDPEIDPKVLIYDQSFTQIGYSDDDDGRNFSAEVAMEAGKPYFCHIGIYYEDARGSYKVVTERLDTATSIIIGSDDLVMEQGENVTLSASFTPEGCWQEKYTFTSSDESVVEVNGRYIYAVGGGEAVVTVTSQDTSLTDTINVTVNGVPTIELDTTYTTEIPAGSENDYVRYAFKPTVTGLYTITSGEAVGEGVIASVILYDKVSDLRSNTTESGSFRLTYELGAGETYYYDVYLTNADVDRSIDFMVTQEDETAFPQAYVNTDYLISITNPGDGVFYMFRPTMTGEYTIFSSGEEEETDPKLIVYDDEWGWVTSNDDGANDGHGNFLLTYVFEAGETYYLKNIIYHDDCVGTYTMHIKPEFELLESATISGTVSGVEDDTHVVIWFTKEGFSEPAYEVVLDGNGEYMVSDVPLATYEVKVMAEGYETVTERVVIEGDLTFDVELEPEKAVYDVLFYLDATDEYALFGYSVKEGECVTQPADPAQEGKIFLGWYVGDTLYDFSTPVTGNLSLVAKFEDIAEEPEILKGDTNGDGSITLADAMQAFYHVNEKVVLEEDAILRADVNGDGELTLADAMKIFYYVNEKIDSL